MNSSLNSRILPPYLTNRRGATIVLVAILMFVFLGIAALAVDLSHLYVVRNELQNAADAGALAGARFLYNGNGTSVNTGANQIAFDVATANKALANSGGGIAVDVNWPGNDVQRGHWSFATNSFQANESTTAPPDLTKSTAELDSDPNFINAVKVMTRRQATPAASYFARIFGYDDFELSTEAIAYIGFAGDLGPGEVDQPIAICKQSILFDDAYNCNIGRMLNSGSNDGTSNTGGWTNFTQDPCDTANPTTLRPLICSADGNPTPITFNEGMGAINGVADNIFRDLETCWMNKADSDGDGIPDTTWELTLPVIDCPGNAVDNCANLMGAVTLKVVWVQRDNPGYDLAPKEMNDSETGSWPSDEDLNMLVQDLEPYFVGGGPNDNFPVYAAGTTVNAVFDGETGNNSADQDSGRVRWTSFVKHFNLRNAGPGDSAPYATFAFKSIYFLPSCEPQEPRGNTGGENFGILAEIPKLVK